MIVCVIKKKTLFIVSYVYGINMQLFINISVFLQSKKTFWYQFKKEKSQYFLKFLNLKQLWDKFNDYMLINSVTFNFFLNDMFYVFK